MTCQWRQLEEGSPGVDECCYATTCFQSVLVPGGRLVVQHYSRGNIFPLSTCLCLAFSGPPSAFFVCRALRRSMASFSAWAFCLNSGDETSTLLRMMETCSAWKECVCVAMHRLSWKGFVLVHARFEAWTISLSSGGERSEDGSIGAGECRRGQGKGVRYRAQRSAREESNNSTF